MNRPGRSQRRRPGAGGASPSAAAASLPSALLLLALGASSPRGSSALSAPAPRAKPGMPRPPLPGTHPDYPYENIVLQGGGAKGIIYGGVGYALAELGVLQHLKRFGGASIGSGVALLFALGLDSAQIAAEADLMDMAAMFDGGKDRMTEVGKNLVLAKNLFDNDMMGMHPADGIEELFGGVMEKYTGNADLTFLDLYQQLGVELAISVSNVSRQQMEYCHVNTTPGMPIKEAIRASMSLPILWSPKELSEGEKYVDGGVFNNFPIKAFDGWFLSTQPGDGFLTRCAATTPEVLQDDVEPHKVIKSMRQGLGGSFVEPNMKTIGFRVGDHKAPDDAAYASYLQDMELELAGGEADDSLTSRLKEIPYPDTKLANKFLKRRSKELDLLEDTGKWDAIYADVYKWFLRHSKELEGSGRHIGPPHSIATDVLIETLNKYPPAMGPEFYGVSSWEELLKCETGMDRDGKGYVTRTDTANFWADRGVRHAYLKNRKPTPITSVAGLTGELIMAILTVSEEGLLRDANNNKRICTLDSDYVSMLDLNLEQGDRDCLRARGKVQTLEWIRKKAAQEIAQEEAKAGIVQRLRAKARRLRAKMFS